MRKYTIPTAFTEEQIDREYTGDLSTLNAFLGAALTQEPDATGSGRGPLTIWTGYYFGKARMTKTEAMTELGVAAPNFVANLQAGDPNPFFPFIDSLNQSGNNIIRRGVLSEMTPENDDDLSWVNVGRMAMLYGVGGDVDGLEVYAQVDPLAEVPEGLPGRTYPEVDENGDPTGVDLVKTWEEWKPSTHTFHELDGNTYVALVYAEKYLKASEWVPLYLAGLPVLTRTEFLALPRPEEVV
jgi:hypothetical protein